MKSFALSRFIAAAHQPVRGPTCRQTHGGNEENHLNCNQAARVRFLNGNPECAVKCYIRLPWDVTHNKCRTRRYAVRTHGHRTGLQHKISEGQNCGKHRDGKAVGDNTTGPAPAAVVIAGCDRQPHIPVVGESGTALRLSLALRNPLIFAVGNMPDFLLQEPCEVQTVKQQSIRISRLDDITLGASEHLVCQQ